MAFVITVGEIEPGYVESTIYKFREYVFIPAGWPDSGHYFGSSHVYRLSVYCRLLLFARSKERPGELYSTGASTRLNDCPYQPGAQEIPYKVLRPAATRRFLVKSHEKDGPKVSLWDVLTPIERLRNQLEFVVEIDKLKEIHRRTDLISGRRKENSAEHCWHLALMAMVFKEHREEVLDMDKVLQMVLLHDVVEIDAGDTYCYDVDGNRDKKERERNAADRIFGLLPSDQAGEFQSLWEEFEEGATPEARYAAALDRLMPLLHNFFTGGRSWKEHGIVKTQVMERCAPIRAGSSELWALTLEVVDEAVRQGYLEDC